MTDEQYEALSPEMQQVYRARQELRNTLFNITSDGRLDIQQIEAFSIQVHHNLRLVENQLSLALGDNK